LLPAANLEVAFQENLVQSTNQRSGLAVWPRPAVGSKLISNGVLSQDGRSSSVIVVCRNVEGLYLGVFTRVIEYLVDSKSFKALTCVEALSLAVI
jgi:hypothetical protein